MKFSPLSLFPFSLFHQNPWIGDSTHVPLKAYDYVVIGGGAAYVILTGPVQNVY
jgi:hypothetical protein